MSATPTPPPESSGGSGWASADAVVVGSVAALHQILDGLAAVDPADLSGFGLGEEVASLLGARRRLDAVTAMLASRFAHTDEAESAGYRTPVDFLGTKVRDTPASLKALLNRHALMSQRFPLVEAAWRDGRFSAAHVDAVTHVWRKFPSLRDQLPLVQEQLIALAAKWEPKRFREELTALCHRHDPAAVADDEAKNNRETFLNVSPFGDGLVAIDGVLPVDLGAAFIAALDAARAAVRREGAKSEDAGETGPGEGQRRRSVDNLAALARLLAAVAALGGPEGLGEAFGERHVMHVAIPVESLAAGITPVTRPQARALAELDAIDPNPPPDTGPPGSGRPLVEPGWIERKGLMTLVISALLAQVLACDAAIDPIVIDRVGRAIATLPRQRTIPRHLRRAVLMRDGHCRFPGCRYAIDEVHHIRFWSRGGLTELANLLGLCGYHHRAVHYEGWVIVGDPNGSLGFVAENGRTHSSNPAIAA